MANRTFADYAASLSSGTLDSVIGLEGSTVKTGGAASATVETTGTITGTAAVLVPCFPIPDTNAYSITGSVIVKCTDAGGGTVVVGECTWYLLDNSQINNETVINTGENTENQSSMGETVVAIEDINSGQLRISITPPFDTADATSEFSYKIRLSGFSL